MLRTQIYFTDNLPESGLVIQTKSLMVYSLGVPSGSTITGLITVSLIPTSGAI